MSVGFYVTYPKLFTVWIICITTKIECLWKYRWRKEVVSYFVPCIFSHTLMICPQLWIGSQNYTHFAVHTSIIIHHPPEQITFRFAPILNKWMGQCCHITSTLFLAKWNTTVLSWAFKLNSILDTAEIWHLKGCTLKANEAFPNLTNRLKQINLLQVTEKKKLHEIC